MTQPIDGMRPAAAACTTHPPGASGVQAGEAISVASTLLETSRFVTALLEHLSPDVWRRTERITRIAMRIVEALDLDSRWEFEVAARLSQVGCVTLGSGALDALAGRAVLDEDADRTIASHPLIARDLLSDVRRLADVRDMISRQREPFTVAGLAWGGRCPADRATLGGRLLHVAVDAEALLARGVPAGEVVARLQEQPDEYDQELVGALAGCVEDAVE